jgi:hypothetical protein
MISHGFYFLHSTETCLVGYKCPEGEKVDYRAKVTNDLIISDLRKKSQKPDELYTIIDLIMPESKKIEIFARNHNIREGWFSVGNQIGEVFEKWKARMHCDACQSQVRHEEIRYKSRKVSNYDICAKCLPKIAKTGENKNEYFEITNLEEEILHNFIKCDNC